MYGNMLDPFYGISNSGSETARWLNRALLIGELYILYKLGEYQVQYHPHGDWIWFIFIPLSFTAINTINGLIRKLWNIVLVIIYGTSDPRDIARYARQMEAQREAERNRIRAAKDALQQATREASLSSGRRPVAQHSPYEIRFVDEQ